MKIINKNFGTVVSVVFVALLVQGCAKKIDHREARNIRGLIYKMSDSEPFTGIIKNEPWGIDIPEPAIGSCQVEFKNGVKDGNMVCTSNSGVKLLESSWADGKKNGVEKIWEVKTGKLSSETHYKAGNKDGLREIFNPYLDVLIEKDQWSGNHRSGEQKIWDVTGKTLLIELTWADGKKSGMERTDSTEEHYKDGKFDGVLKTYGLPRTEETASLVMAAGNEIRRLGGGALSYSLIPGSFVESEESYKDGVLVVKPELQQCVNAKRIQQYGSISRAVWNDEIRAWALECGNAKQPPAASESNSTPISNNKPNACLDAKIAAFRKEEGEKKPIINEVLREWEEQCLKKQQ